MSKPVKQLIRKDLISRLHGTDSLAVVGFTGVDANDTNRIRGRLIEKEMRMTVVKNSIARQAFSQLGIEPASDLLDGPCALVYGGESVVNVVRELLDIGREVDNFTVKGALLEGQPFGPDRVEELSNFPTRDEALGRVVSCILSGGSKLSAAMLGPGSALASILKQIEEDGGGPKASGETDGGPEAPAGEETPAAEAAPAAAEQEAPAAETPEADEEGESEQ